MQVDKDTIPSSHHLSKQHQGAHSAESSVGIYQRHRSVGVPRQRHTSNTKGYWRRRPHLARAWLLPLDPVAQAAWR